MASGYRVERWSRFEKPNAAALRMKMVQEGYEVFQWADLPNVVYGLHKHDEPQSHWIVSGSLEITVEGRGSFQLGPGDRDFMPAGTYHSARVIGEEAVVYLIGEVRSVSAPKQKGRVRKDSVSKTKKASQKTQDSGSPRKKRMTKAEKAAAEAEFDAIRKMFESS